MGDPTANFHFGLMSDAYKSALDHCTVPVIALKSKFQPSSYRNLPGTESYKSVQYSEINTVDDGGTLRFQVPNDA